MGKYVTYPNPIPNGRPLVDCRMCGERKVHWSKGLCCGCYKKQWSPPLIVCKKCGKQRPHKAFGLCSSCHVKVYHYDNVLASNAKKSFGLALDDYRHLTERCALCDFDKIVELHHKDGNTNNNDVSNFLALCPNCHKMLHSAKYTDEMIDRLKKRGICVKDAMFE